METAHQFHDLLLSPISHLSVLTPAKRELINSATLHWSQLVGTFVTVHQTIYVNKHATNVSHTIEIQYPPVELKHKCKTQVNK